MWQDFSNAEELLKVDISSWDLQVEGCWKHKSFDVSWKQVISLSSKNDIPKWLESKVFPE